MGYATASTVWPSQYPSSEVKQLLDSFFSLVDNKASDSGEKLATGVFTKDGKFFATSGNFEGSAEIAKSRTMAWNSVSSRRHELFKVYVNSVDGLDLILVGAVTVQRADGTQSTHEFVARSLIHDSGSEAPRIKHYQVLIPATKDSYLPIFMTES